MTDDRRPSKPPLITGIDRLFRTTLVLIPIGVLGNILFTLLITDPGLLKALDEFPRGYLMLAVALGLLPWVTNSLRLMLWTHFLGYPLTFREAMQMTLAVDLGSAVAPTAVGGGFFKWGMLVQRGISPGTAASITTFPNIEDLVFFTLALPVAVVWSASWDLPVLRQVAAQFHLVNSLIVLAAAVAIAFFTWLAIRWVLLGGLGVQVQRRGLHLLAGLRRKLRGTWHDAREVFRLIAVRGKSRFALSLALTAIQWIARYSVVSALIAFLGVPVQPVLFWVLQWVVFTLTHFIPTPGAAGAAEAAFYFIYSPFIPPDVIGLATAGWRFLTFYLQLGLASILFFVLNRVGRGSPTPEKP